MNIFKGITYMCDECKHWQEIEGCRISKGLKCYPDGGPTYKYFAPINEDKFVTAPTHYTSGNIECIDAIRSALTEEEFRGYCKGNVLKYTWREKLKGRDDDLKKAGVYLSWLTTTPEI